MTGVFHTRDPVEPSGLRLYFVRHGESEANVLGEFSNRPGKHPLTEKGRQQAMSLARNLHSASVRRIISSPVLRALQTAEILSSELSVPFAVDDALREFDVGVLEGRSDKASWDAYWRVVQAWMTGDWDRRIEGGESFLDIRERFLPFVGSVVREYSPVGGGVVLVGHGGTYRCMLPLVFENVDFGFVAEQGLAETGMVVAMPGPHGLVCRSWGAVEFQST